MATKTTTIYTCDNCGVSVEAGKSYLSPDKWWELYQVTEKGEDDKEFDLCSLKCVEEKVAKIK